MGYQNCIFDLYGTLVDIRTDEDSPRLWERMAGLYAQYGASYRPGELQNTYRRLVRELEGGESSRQDTHEAHPEIQIEQVFRRLYEEKGADSSPELTARTGLAFRRWSTEYLRLYPGAAELLVRLRAGGRRLWLLSNAQSLFTRRELDQLKISHLFDGIYLSSDCGCKKPDPRFFQLLLRQQAIDPKTAVMVGNDGACDIEGAQAVGLATVYIRSNISPIEPVPKADYALSSMELQQVEKLLM